MQDWVEDYTGRRVRSYFIEKLLGKGGMGHVYLATQESVNRQVAVKVILPEYSRNERFIRNFDNEAITIANVESQYVVKLFDYWRDTDAAFMIMQYMRGGSLAEKLKQGKGLRYEEVETILNRVARALEAAHKRQIVHSDLKPGNLLLDDNGDVYLADFGLAWNVNRESPSWGYTLAYAAPEQLEERRLSPQTDQYSLGVVLYELLTGSIPFDGTDSTRIREQHLKDPLPRVTAIRSELPSRIDEIIARATSKDPNERYPSVLELLEAFLDARPSTVQVARPLIAPTIFNPYKGLEPFDRADEDIFYGREALRDRIINRLISTRFLAVVGPSGSGKSSVVKAGVVPRLKRGDIANSSDWFIGTMAPGSNVFANVAQAILGLVEEGPANLEELLRREPTQLGILVRDLLPEDKPTELLLVIDQFEEVFTLNSETDAGAFLAAMTEAANLEGSRIRFLITLRADFLDRPLQVPGFGELVQQNLETVLLPNRSELQAAIAEPARRAGVEMDTDLVNQIIQDVGHEPGMLPLLQYALRQLFERLNRHNMRLTLYEYREIGGVTGALAGSAQSLFNQLSAEEQEAAKRLFLQLVTITDDMEPTRRRRLLTELPQESALERVREAFGKARLLTFDYDPKSRLPTVEIAHEALIRRWDVLRKWIEENRDALRTLRQLQTDTRTWMENDLSEDFLAPEGPLTLYEALIGVPDIQIGSQERGFIQRSREKERQRIIDLEERLRIAEENERRKQEQIELEQQATEQQRQAARRFLGIAGVAGLLFVAALLFGVWAIIAQENANNNAERAEANATTAVAAQRTAEAAATEAVEQAATATAAQGEALNQEAIAQAAASEAAVERDRALIAEATAQVAADNAETQQAIAQAAASAAATAATGEAAQRIEAENANEAALSAQQTAEYNAQAAAIAATQAAENLIEARTQEARAESAAEEAAQRQEEAETAAAEAESQRATAEFSATQVSVQTNNSRARSLAARSELLLNAGNYLLAYGLAIEANNTADAPPEVQRVLSLAAYNGPRTIGVVNRLRDVTAMTRCDSQWFTTGAADGDIRFWSIVQDQLVSVTVGRLSGFTEHSTAVTAITCNEEALRTASGDAGGTILVWDSFDGRNLVRLDSTITGAENVAGKQVTDMAFIEIEGKQYLLAAYRGASDENVGLLLLWDPEDETAAPRTVVGHDDGVSSILVLSGNRLITASLDGEIILWDASQTTFDIERRTRSESPVQALALSPNEERFVTAGTDGNILEWDVQTMQIQGRMVGHVAAVNSVEYGYVSDSISGEEQLYLVSASDDHTVILWDAQTYRELRRYRAHGQRVVAAYFDITMNYIISTSADQYIMQWDIVGGAETARGTATDALTQNFLDVGGSYAVTAFGNTLYLWDQNLAGSAEDFSQEATQNHNSPISALAISPDGEFIVSGDQEGYVVLWSTSIGTREPIGASKTKAHDGAVTSIAFSANGETVMTGGADRNVRVWDVSLWEDYASDVDYPEDLPGHTGAVTAVAFCCSADSSYMNLAISGSDTGNLFLWEIGLETATLTAFNTEAGNHYGGITALDFSPDGRLIVSASVDSTLILWEVVGDGDEIPYQVNYQRTLRQHTGIVRAVDFSSDGTQIISASDDGTVIIWQIVPPAEQDEDMTNASDTSAPETTEGESVSVTNYSAEPIGVLLGHTADVNSVRFIEAREDVDGREIWVRYALSSGADGRVIRWRVHDRNQLQEWTEANRLSRNAIPLINPVVWGEFCTILALEGVTNQSDGDGQCLPSTVETTTPTATVDFETFTPTITPTPTATYTPTQAAALAPTRQSGTVVAMMANENQMTLSGWYEAERRDIEIIDLSFRRNILSWRSFEYVYGNFILHTRIDWGAGSLQDRCGVLVGFQNRDNYYRIELDQLGNAHYFERTEGQWADSETDDVQQFDVNNSTRNDPTLTIIGIVDRNFGLGPGLYVYVNDNWSDYIRFNVPVPGYVALAASVSDRSREAGCIFTDTWVADLDRSEPQPPTATPAPLSTLYAPSAVLDSPEEIVQRVALSVSEIGTMGYLTEQVPRLLGDLSGISQIIRRYAVQTPQSYTQFIAGTEITFTSGAVDNRCGFSFYTVDSENYYMVELNPLGQLRFRERENGVTLPPFAFDRAVPPTRTTTQLVVVGLNRESIDSGLPTNRFIFFVDGEYVGETSDSTITGGAVYLLASVGQALDPNGCTFERAWVWTLDQSNPPPTSTPVPTSIAESPLVLGEPQVSNLPEGGRERWEFTSAEVQDVVVTVRASRPANGASPQDQVNRRLLNVELLVTNADGSYVEYSSDIQPGVDTDVRLPLTLEANMTYRFEVYSLVGSTSGDYTITIEPAGGN